MLKQTKKHVHTLKPLKLSKKLDDLKQIERKFPKCPLNDLIIGKLKEIMQSQNNIKLDDLE